MLRCLIFVTLISLSSVAQALEAKFVEIVFSDRKNLVIGCIYCHPSSKICLDDFPPPPTPHKLCGAGDHRYIILWSGWGGELNLANSSGWGWGILLHWLK